MSVVSLSLSPRPPMVAVEMAGQQVVAVQLAVLQVNHLTDEVDGDVVTLTLPIDGAGCWGPIGGGE